MEDIVAVEVRLESGESRYFLTWGRIQDAVDPGPLEALVLRQCRKFALGGTPIAACLCPSLQEASKQPYFYECFFDMCQKITPFGPKYQQWRKRIAEAMEKGKGLWYLGKPFWYYNDTSGNTLTNGCAGTPRRSGSPKVQAAARQTSARIGGQTVVVVI